MDENILVTVKRFVNVSPEDDAFDMELLGHINMAFAILYQIGATKDRTFLADFNSRWSDYTTDPILFSMVKPYVCYCTRIGFDPPSGGTLEAFKQSIADLEWRIQMQKEVFDLEDEV